MMKGKTAGFTELMDQQSRLYDAGEAARFLRSEGYKMWRVCDAIDRYVTVASNKPNAPTRKHLIDSIKATVGAQNYSNWYRQTVKTISRGNVLTIALTLDLTIEEAEGFLNCCCHSGFYYRDINDIIYMYCLKYHLGVNVTKQMLTRYQAYDIQNDIKENPMLTYEIQNDFNTTDIDDFDGFIEANDGYFGSYNRKAYEEFADLYNDFEYGFKLNKEDDDSEESACYYISLGLKRISVIKNFVEKYQRLESAPITDKYRTQIGQLFDSLTKEDEIRSILERHGLRVSRPPFTGSDEDIATARDISEHFTPLLEKNIVFSALLSYLPDRSTVSKILNKTPIRTRNERTGKTIERILEVPRNYIILLKMYWEIDTIDARSEIDAGQHVIDLINMELEYCGMQKLYSRNPFDWLIMNTVYAVAENDGDAFARVEKFLDAVSVGEEHAHD